MDLKVQVANLLANLLALPSGAFTPEQMADAHIRLQPGFSERVKDLMRQLREAAWAEAATVHGDDLDERLSDEEVLAWLAKEQAQAQQPVQPEQPEQQMQMEPFVTRQVILAGAAAVTMVAIAIKVHSDRRS